MAALNAKQVKDLLVSTGAILEGHFLLSSGKHAGKYIQCARLLQHPVLAHRLCLGMAEKTASLGHIDVVIGPALGGVVFAYELARVLAVRSIFAERKEGRMSLRRGFQIERGEHVLIAEDVVTTGRSSLEVAQVVEEYGGEVVGIVCIVDRRVEEKPLPFPVISAAQMQIPLYEPDECPLCRRGIPYTKPGSREPVPQEEGEQSGSPHGLARSQL